MKKETINNIYSWFNFPAFLFHEGCHLLAMIIFSPVAKVYWDKSTGHASISKWRLTYHLTMRFECKYPLVSLIISTAPLIGWFVSLVCLVGHPLSLYFAFGGFMAFSLSECDKREAIRHIQQIIKPFRTQ